MVQGVHRGLGGKCLGKWKDVACWEPTKGGILDGDANWLRGAWVQGRGVRQRGGSGCRGNSIR